MEHEYYMDMALKLAEIAGKLGEIPIGCVIVRGGEVIGKGFNLRNTRKSSLCHAELIAINEASARLGDWRLEECAIYVTLEPCPMCAGAIVSSRIKTAVFGARNPKAGSCGSIVNLLQVDKFNHQVEIIEGIRGKECSEALTEFFRKLRKRGGN